MDFVHELVLPSDDIPFKIFCFEGGGGNYSVSKHWHQCMEFFCVRKGTLKFYINSKEYILTQGECVLVNPNEIHSIEAKEKNEVIVLQIPLSMIEMYSHNKRIRFKQIENKRDEVIVGFINTMYDEYISKKSMYEYKVLSEYYALLHYLLCNYVDESVTQLKIKYNKNVERLSQVTEYIEENYMRDLSLEELAERFGFTPTYLSRLFKNCTNINYKEFLDSVRLEHAYKELLNTNHTVVEITYNNGFPNNKSFITAFKKRYNCTPAEYRKRMVEQ